MSQEIYVEINKGFYRGQPVTGRFKIVKAWNNTGAKGGVITIMNPNPAPGTPPAQRVQCELADIKLVYEDGTEYVAPEVPTGVDGEIIHVESEYEAKLHALESEEDAMKRIAETFAMQDKLTDACARGTIRGLIISGPPGVGKSFGVEKQLATANMFRSMGDDKEWYKIITGGVSPIGLYQLLWNFRKKGRVLVFDDCDGVLYEEESLSLLKGVLNSGDKRRVAWNKESRVLLELGIDKEFDFEGTVMFLSNVDFEDTINSKSRIASHLSAMLSRCHYLDLEISSTRDKLLRIKQCIRDGMLNEFEFNQADEKMIQDFIIDNHQFLRELSLRTVKKVADFVKVDKKEWFEMAESTVLTRDAKFKRLLDKKVQEMEKAGLRMKT